MKHIFDAPIMLLMWAIGIATGAGFVHLFEMGNL